MVDEDITILGDTNKDGTPAVTIDGQFNGRIINCTSESTFANLIITQGSIDGFFGGGGMSITNDTTTINNCVFLDNSAQWGAGLSIGSGNSGSKNIIDCRFEGNQCNSFGGGLYVSGYGIDINNCTFSGNSAVDGGGAIIAEYGSIGLLEQCTFENNSSVGGDGGGAVLFYELGNWTVTDCTVTGNTSGSAPGGGFLNRLNSNTIEMSSTSICSNTPDQVSGDYVDAVGNFIRMYCPDEDGILNVPTEYPNIELAIDLALDGQTVLISSGTYIESSLVVDVNITVRGETNVDGSPAVTIEGDFTDCIFYCSSDATIEDLIITGGSRNHGGGLYITGASPTIRNCTVRNNSAINGGGIYCNSSSPSLINCTINKNGAVYWQEADTGRGGGLCNFNSSPSLTDTVISGNSATWGGGICNTDGSTPSLVGCTVSNNIGKISGGGVYSVLSSAAVQNTSFCANSPTHLIGAWNDLGGNSFSDECGGGEPPVCFCDMNDDYSVDVLDLLYLIAVWGTDNPAGDVSGDGWVDVADLLELIANWGDCRP